MFEVMTLVTCDGPPGGGGWARQTTQGRRQLWRWLHTATAPGSTTKNPGLTPARPGVHSADINEPAAKDPVGIVGILRFFFVARRRCACDVSTMDTDKPSDLFPRLIVAPRTVTLPRRPARASVS